MCGIAGFLGPWSETFLGAMVDSLAHRGPDGSGVVHDREAGLGLGHRRLSIIDLSDAAAQPMRTADGRYTITYNGELYNYRALRRELMDRGVAFRSDSDTEVLLELFAREGLDCLDRLHGIFAFAVWDSEARRLTLARDHLGVKPLYYANLARGFLFASELRTLLLCPDLQRRLDPVMVADLVGFAWSASDRTMLRDARKLRPGCAIVVDADGTRLQRYWRAPLPAPDPLGPAPTAADLTALIDTVVSDQMVADVEVGALLSGGVDSSAIVAAMCRAIEPARITTFCAAVEGGGDGADNFGADLAHARAVANALGVALVEVPTEANLVESLPDMVWSLDEPSADFAALQTHLLAAEARRNGIKVLLSGVGGDDLFTGYGRHTAAYLYGALKRPSGLCRLVALGLRRARPTTLRGRRLQRLGLLLGLDEDSMLVEAMSFSPVLGAERMHLMAPELRRRLPPDGVPDALAASLRASAGLHPVERLLDMEINGFLPDLNLNYTDKMAMLAGVEVRVPLIDTRLVWFAAGLALDARIGYFKTKRILRESQAERLPASVLTRPKQGFGVPIRAWLRGPARPLLEDLTAERTVALRGLFSPGAVVKLRTDFLEGRNDAALTLFPLMAIELWCRALDAHPTL